MLLYKAVSAVLAAEILFSLFNISSPMKNMSESDLAAESITDVHKSEYAHLLNDERFNDYFFEEEVDSDADEALASEYKEKLIKKYADDIISDSRIGEYINIQDFYSTSPVYRLKELETLSTYVFQNYDGTNTTYYMSETVKYISDDGMIREKNIRFEQSSKGYIVNESDVQLTIPNSPLDEVIMNTVLGKVKISVSSKTDRTELPKTVFLETENSVTYYNVFDKGQHLKYTPLLSGVREDK